MSLKAFHIFFIIISTLMSFSVGIWGVAAYRDTHTFGYLLMAVLCGIVGIALAAYGVIFLRKLRHESFL